jgi:FkbM family methyltransferase
MTFEEFCVGRPFRSQLRQDLFAVYCHREARELVFVEVGAANGILSNTLLLEQQYEWSGLLVEPFVFWHEDLERNRPACRIDKRAAWKASGETLEFLAASNPELATLRQCNVDHHAPARDGSPIITVATASLNDLFSEHGIPERFAYLSVDTEGSELLILEAMDWSRYRPTVITVEHNYGCARDDLQQLLTRHGYERRLDNLSQWDDWYVDPERVQR